MADMNDATKRKEPEAAPAAEAKPAETPKEESPAKKQKVSPPDAKVVRKQIEYYLSDENLKHDKFFHDKIAGDAEGWLDMTLILSCNKMKLLRASTEDVVAALKESKLELKGEGIAVRRPGNAPLPAFEGKQQHQKKSQAHAHDGGAVVIFKNLPKGQQWGEVKEKLKAKLPEKVGLWHVSEVNDKLQCFAVCAPFEGDIKFFENCEVELGSDNVKAKAELCFGDLLQSALKGLPRHVRDKREKETRKKQKDRNRPIIVAQQRFVNVGALRGKTREIMNSRSDGEVLKVEGTDFKLIQALLSYHPKGEEKIKGLKGIKVGKSPHADGQTRCFFMIKEDGTEEDVSLKKCVDALELNPPYAEEKKPAAAPKAEAKAEKKTEAAAEKKPEAKAEEKTEAKAEEKTEAKAEETKAEEKTETKAEEKTEAKAEEKTEAQASSA